MDRRNNGKNRRPQGKPYEPDVIQKAIATKLQDQIAAYDAAYNMETRERNRLLFNLENGRMSIDYIIKEYNDTHDELPEDKNLKYNIEYLMAHLIERTIRTNRETNELERATCSMIIIDEQSALPAYYVNAYMNGNGVGSINVTPIGDLVQYGFGPVRKHSYRVPLGK